MSSEVKSESISYENSPAQHTRYCQITLFICVNFVQMNGIQAINVMPTKFSATNTSCLVRLWRKWFKKELLPRGGGGGVLPEKFGRGGWPASQNPYPIYDQNLWFSLPYLWPDQKFDTLFMIWLLHH